MKKNVVYWKWVVMLLCIFITAFTLSRYALLVNHLLRIQYNGLFEVVMVTGMIAFQYLWIRKYKASIQWAYFFRMLMVSLMGSVLLWPLLIFNRYHLQSDKVNLLYFFSVVAIMFIVHKRMVAQMQLPVLLSYTWILYRIIILIFILPL
ncbi:MAG: hypothetical protein JST86_04930 [Bacteroidetes bacterium]|nr:hypothetical protein [Bacteroidota bacterium]